MYRGCNTSVKERSPFIAQSLTSGVDNEYHTEFDSVRRQGGLPKTPVTHPQHTKFDSVHAEEVGLRWMHVVADEGQKSRITAHNHFSKCRRYERWSQPHSGSCTTDPFIERCTLTSRPWVQNRLMLSVWGVKLLGVKQKCSILFVDCLLQGTNAKKKPMLLPEHLSMVCFELVKFGE